MQQNHLHRPRFPEPSDNSIEPAIVETPEAPVTFQWVYVLVPLGVIAAAGIGIGIAILLKRRNGG